MLYTNVHHICDFHLLKHARVVLHVGLCSFRKLRTLTVLLAVYNMHHW